MRIVIFNLMPTKVATETQLLRCLSNTPLQIEFELLKTDTYQSKHTSSEHLSTFYKTFRQIKDQRFDGMIITGAPVEQMDFEQVEYWRELCEILDWTRENVFTSLFICWGAQAALYHYYGIEKYALPQKMFGIYPHTVEDLRKPLFRGFDEVFNAPHSRHTEIKAADIQAHPELEVLSVSEEAGLYIAGRKDGREIFVTGHPEYDALTLDDEYRRDKSKGLPIEPPYNYFPGNNDALPPRVTWRSHANLLYTNWLNYYVYQNTPYDLKTMG
jgi:homoserine O-succinyltransferase